MKKISLLFLLIAFSFASFSQKASLTKDEYLTKSKNQKTTAWILASGGAALIAIGLAVGNGKEASFDQAGAGVIVGGLGVVSIIGSIPLFIASGKNKKRGMAMAFKNEPLFFPKKGSFTKLSCPSLTIRIGL
jgi:hypothetical protein